ncbi:DHA2 family efflux MFS transporter permease subunit [Gordonia neofelifaecis]|nr:DHA2 family efflux MFS transporter permease subunit [Gordonia neofelifaecis]
MTAVLAPAPPDRIDPATWRLCWVIVLGAFASGLDASIVNVGLESINRELGATLSTTQWIVSGYLLALAVSLPAAGWLGRRFGTGRVWLPPPTAFTLASIGCAVAPTIGVLIAARVAQGLAGGVLIPTGQAILGAAVGPQRLGRVMGALGIAVSAAPAIGPLAGGLILAGLSWPWLFAVNVPIGVAGLVLGRRIVPRGVRQDAGPLHLPGFVAISAGLFLVVLATSSWGAAGALTPGIAVLGLAAMGCLAVFVLLSRSTAHPVLDLALYRIRGFRAGSVAAFFSGALVFGSGVVHALYFQLGQGLDPLHAGLSLIGAAAATAVAAPLTGRWIDRHGPAPVATVGGVLAVATTVPMVVLGLEAPAAAVQSVLVGYGVAVSMVAMPAGITAYKAVSGGQLPDAITQVNILQRIGGSIGGAVCAVLIAGNTSDPEHGFRLAFAALVVGAVGAVASSALIRRATAA